ncbi:MAG: hypothetical protein WBO24_13900 [Nitrospirales bacterium]
MDSLTGVTHYTHHTLMGDHPLAQKSQAETDTTRLEKGSLYVMDRSGALVLLRPFLTRQQLDDGRWGTFFLDKFDHKTQSCELKCLEGPRMHKSDSQYRAFAAVGMRV